MFFILLWIALFMFLVLVHELWHFCIAKRRGVKVLEFGIGIPPRAFKIYTDKSGTEYTFNWLPLGWFVRLKGEDPHDEGTFFAKDSFITKWVWSKIAILLGWVIVNTIFAWLFFFVAFWQWIMPLQVIPSNTMKIKSESYIIANFDFLQSQWFTSGSVQAMPITIESVMPEGLASKSWLITGDHITHINGKAVDTLNLSDTLKSYFWQAVTMQIVRNEQPQTINFVCPSDNCFLGILMNSSGNIEILPIKFDAIPAMGAALYEIKAQVHLSLYALWQLGSKLLSFNKEEIKESVDKLSWPVWAVKVGEVIYTNYGVWLWIAFAWMISLALAIFNVLPIPALDWGRILWVIIQSALRLKPQTYFTIESYINLFFFVVLFWLWIYIIFQDLSKFWWVNIPGM